LIPRFGAAQPYQFAVLPNHTERADASAATLNGDELPFGNCCWVMHEKKVDGTSRRHRCFLHIH
jgi:hypothetical protein